MSVLDPFALKVRCDLSSTLFAPLLFGLLDRHSRACRQQQPILHRTQVIGYVLLAEQRNGATPTLGDALVELLQDISEAARAIGAIVQPVTSSRRG
jgi:hypothetical protein